MSFRRLNKSSKSTPSGCRISTLNGQILTSTGVASLDEMMGGGMPLGRVLLLKQDRYTGYANLLLKYWIAQGLAHSQTVCVASKDVSLEEYLVDLMSIVEGKQESQVQNNEEEQEFIPQLPAIGGRSLGSLRSRDDQMSIAWRYQRLPQVASGLSGSAFRGPNSKLIVLLFFLRFNILPYL